MRLIRHCCRTKKMLYVPHFLPVLRSCSSLLSSLEQPLALAIAMFAIDSGMVMNCGWPDDEAGIERAVLV